MSCTCEFYKIEIAYYGIHSDSHLRLFVDALGVVLGSFVNQSEIPERLAAL